MNELTYHIFQQLIQADEPLNSTFDRFDKTLMSPWQAAIEKFMSNSTFFDVGL
jgi:hypothetical protein